MNSLCFVMLLTFNWRHSSKAFDPICGCPEYPLKVCVLLGNTYRTILNNCLAICIGERFAPVMFHAPGPCQSDTGRIADTVDPECRRRCRKCQTKRKVVRVGSNDDSSIVMSDKIDSFKSYESEESKSVEETNPCDADEVQVQQKLFLNAEQNGLCIEDEYTVCAFNGRTYSSACLVECDLGIPAVLHWGVCADNDE